MLAVLMRLSLQAGCGRAAVGAYPAAPAEQAAQNQSALGTRRSRGCVHARCVGASHPSHSSITCKEHSYLCNSLMMLA